MSDVKAGMGNIDLPPWSLSDEEVSVFDAESDGVALMSDEAVSKRLECR